MTSIVTTVALAGGILLACQLHTQAETASASGAGPGTDSAQDIRPLLIGSSVPDLTLQAADGNRYDLNAAIGRKPTVVIFYRGGWCPYCNMQLGQLQTLVVTGGAGYIGSHTCKALAWHAKHIQPLNMGLSQRGTRCQKQVLN